VREPVGAPLVSDRAQGRVGGLRAARHAGSAACQRPGGCPHRHTGGPICQERREAPYAWAQHKAGYAHQGVGRLGPHGWFEIPIRMARGFVYLVAVMDWYSRRVLSWRVSNSMTADFCVEALEEAIARYGTPEIFNTDQGSQFTAANFIAVLDRHKIRISMDGRGAWRDNVFVERLWRSRFVCTRTTASLRPRPALGSIFCSTTASVRTRTLDRNAR
jgi:transposase InsO family protein